MAAPAANHFYDMQEAASLKISKIAEKGTAYTYEDVVWHAWEKIPHPYFPERAATATAPRYSIDREAYRGPSNNPLEHKPDVIVVRIHNVQQMAGQRPTAIERDVLWIECKAPVYHQPNGWHKVLGEAVDRLASAHPTRTVYLILAVGMEWMPFVWDPSNPAPAGQTMQMIKDVRTQVWDDIDHRIRPVANMANQRHIAGGRIIDTTLAYNLNFWDQDAQGNVIHLADLQLLETFFNLVQGQNFAGANPANF
jgi:hypothetical protein